jgi:hypothetical protein
LTNAALYSKADAVELEEPAFAVAAGAAVVERIGAEGVEEPPLHAVSARPATASAAMDR